MVCERDLVLKAQPQDQRGKGREKLRRDNQHSIDVALLERAEDLQNLGLIAYSPLDDLDPDRLRYAHEIGHQPGGRGVSRICEDKQASERDDLSKDLQPLALKLPYVICDTRQIGPRVGETLHESGGHRIADMGEDHRNLRGRRLRSAGGLILEGNDHVHVRTREGSRRCAGCCLVGLVSIVQANALAVSVT